MSYGDMLQHAAKSAWVRAVSVGEQGLLVQQPMLLDADKADAGRQAGMQAR